MPRATPVGSFRNDAVAHDVGKVPEGRRAQARRGARPTRHQERGRPVVPRAASLPRRHRRHAARQGARRRGGHVRRPRGEHRCAADAAGPAGVPGGAARRLGSPGVRLARPAVPRAPDQEGPAATRHRAGALLPRPPARAARVRDPRGRRRGGARARDGAAGVSRDGRSHASPDSRARTPAPRRPARPGPGPAPRGLARGARAPGARRRARRGAPAGHARGRPLAKRARAGIRFVLKKELTTRLKEHLPFELTGDQRHAIRAITDDMTAPLRMHRLLMGDVGTGKTVVALFAMLLAVENDYQAAIMAPTELLAEQHVATLTRLLEPLALRPDVLLRRLTAAEKAAARERIASGASRLVVGTHALIQESVRFHRLGLAVIDEQHRFGVEQRAALVEKGDAPDVLLLTATPIPRSLALTLYGDLDVT